MSRKRILLIVAAALLGVFFWRTSHDVSPQVSPTNTESRQGDSSILRNTQPIEVNREATEQFNAAYLTPISFYGKVVDEHGDPVDGAAVKLVAIDRPFSDGSKYARTSDALGMFSISGIHGVGLFVSVTKLGYYRTSRSDGTISYGKPATTNERPIPTRSAPTIFVLQHMGDAATLIHLETKGVRVVGNGTPVEIDLATGDTASTGRNATVRVEFWSDNATYGAQGPYSWRARVTVPGGGLIERIDEFMFQAPAEGYAASFDLSMPSTAERWQNGFERQFFARLADGRFARFTINLKTGGLFFTLESFVNPTAGSRNLEFSPTKTIERSGNER